eukprot:1158998-Pelagomonas_calceolata.AAC.1
MQSCILLNIEQDCIKVLGGARPGRHRKVSCDRPPPKWPSYNSKLGPSGSPFHHPMYIRPLYKGAPSKGISPPPSPLPHLHKPPFFAGSMLAGGAMKMVAQ